MEQAPLIIFLHPPTSLHHKAVILSAVFRPVKQHESERRTCAFLARFLLRTHTECQGFGAAIAWAIERSWVGSPSHSEGLCLLRMTAGEVQTDPLFSPARRFDAFLQHTLE